MKRSLYLLLTVFSVLVAACVKEPVSVPDPADGGIPVPVTFNLDLGLALSKADAPASTALDDGSRVNKVFAAVFGSDGSLISTSRIGGTGYDATATMIGGKASVTITLSKGQEYKVVFFAQKDDTYTLSFADGNRATFSYGQGLKANDPDLDAFWAVVDVMPSVTSYNVTLKRPFAQVNVLVPAGNVPEGKTQFSSAMTVKAAPASFDLFAGKAGSDVRVLTFADSAIAAPAFGKYAPAGGVAAYQWVAMNFVLVPESGKINLSVKEKDMPQELALSSIPVRVNGRTNLVGALYAAEEVDGTFNVWIDSGINGGDTPAEEAQDTEITIVDGSTYTQENPLTIDASATPEVSVKLSVNGDTISQVNAGADGKTVMAESADPSVATARVVDDVVVITPVSDGETVVTVTTPSYTKAVYKEQTYKIPVKVSGVPKDKVTPVISVTDPSDLTLSLEVDETATIKAELRDGETVLKDLFIYYASSDEEVASVSEAGMVTALKAGETTITLTSDPTAAYNTADPVTIAVTVTEPAGPEPEGDKIYKLVTSLSELTAGSELLIVAASDSYSKALGVTQNQNNRASADVTIESDVIKNPGEVVEVLKLIGGAVGNTVAFETPDGKYLYDASGSSSNYLRTTEDAVVTAAASFSVGVAEGGQVTLRSHGDAAKYIQYNAAGNSNFFSCYGHTQVDPYLYKLEGSGEGAALVVPSAATPVISCEDNKVTITCSTSGAEIFYTMDGTAPTTASFKYSGPFDITESCTVSAMAVAEGFGPSEIASETCAYKGAENLDLMFDFTDLTLHGLELWPTKYAGEGGFFVYQYDASTAYTFGLTSYIKMNSGDYGTYMMLGNKVANDEKVNPYNQILTLPAIEGYSVTSITILTGSSASANAAASIQDAQGNEVVAKQTLAKGAETTFAIPASSVSAQYRIYVEGTYNCQIAKLGVSLAPAGSVSVDPSVITGGASAVTTTSATLSGTFSAMSGGVQDHGFYWGTSANSLTQTLGLNSSSQETAGFTANLSSLEAGKTYYYQAYAIITGTLTEYKGEIKSFSTESGQSQTGQLPDLGRYELPSISLKEAGKYETGQEYYGNTNWYSFETTNSMQKVVMHTYAYGGETWCNYTTLVDGTRFAPLWTAFEMSADYPDNNVGRNEGWTLDPAIPETWQQAGLKNAGTIGYSRGHFCASNYRQTDKKANQQTFYYTNQAPQQQNGFNGSVWGNLEDGVKTATESCSSSEKLYVVVGVLYEGNLTYYDSNERTDSNGSVVVGSKRVPKPSHFYKLVMKCSFDSSGKTMTSANGVAYLFENKVYESGTKYSGFKTTIDAIEERAGFNFFANVPSDLQDAAEKNKEALWVEK